METATGDRTVALSRSRMVMAALMDVSRSRRLIPGFTRADITEAAGGDGPTVTQQTWAG